MRILYVVDTLNIGGTETQMVKAALRLQRAGHRVTVACLSEVGPLLELLRGSDVPVIEFPKRKTLVSLNGLYQLARMVRFLVQYRFQVVHAHDLWANLFAVPAARLAGTPVIISSRRYLADLEWSTPWRNKVMCMIYRLSTHVLANSEAVRKFLQDRERLAPQKVHVLYNAVDVDRFRHIERNRSRPLLSVRRNSALIVVVANMYSAVKGHDNLIAAASTVCRDKPGAIFLLIGDGRERSRLEEKVEAAGLQKNVLFLGQREGIPQLLASCDLSVLPSDAEGLPNALLEAMAAGLPVVATRVGGVPEVIHSGRNGLLVPPGDPRALADAILSLLDDRELATRLAQAGRERVWTDFSFDRLVSELEQLYMLERTVALPGERRRVIPQEKLHLS